MSAPTGVKQTFNLPLSRIVSGSPTFKQEKDMQGNLKKVPNWWMMVATPKDPHNNQGPVNVALGTIMGCAAAGYQAYPDISARLRNGLAGGFKWKIEDGDSPENVGKEGCAGCWLFKFSTTFGAMQCCDANGTPIDPALVKTGYYVEMNCSVDINGNKDHTAGVYLNPVWVRLVATATEIRSGVSPQEAFRTPAPSLLPPGAAPFVAGSAPPTHAQPAGAVPGHAGNAGNAFAGASAPAVSGPGFAQLPPPPPPQPQPPAVPTAEQIAAHYGVPHHPGFRYDRATNSYQADTAPPPPPPPAAAPGQGAPAFPAQGQGGFPAPSMPAGSFPVTASPGEAFPGAQPHPGFLTGQPAR
jgi:hypothetical protein